MTPDDRGSVTFVDMVLVLPEDQFPWLATDSRDAVSGVDTVDQLIQTARLAAATAHGTWKVLALRTRLKKDCIMTSLLHRRVF
jgi:hypothetical protein